MRQLLLDRSRELADATALSIPSITVSMLIFRLTAQVAATARRSSPVVGSCTAIPERRFSGRILPSRGVAGVVNRAGVMSRGRLVIDVRDSLGCAAGDQDLAVGKQDRI